MSVHVNKVREKYHSKDAEIILKVFDLRPGALSRIWA